MFATIMNKYTHAISKSCEEKQLQLQFKFGYHIYQDIN